MKTSGTPSATAVTRLRLRSAIVPTAGRRNHLAAANVSRPYDWSASPKEPSLVVGQTCEDRTPDRAARDAGCTWRRPRPLLVRASGSAGPDREPRAGPGDRCARCEWCAARSRRRVRHPYPDHARPGGAHHGGRHAERRGPALLPASRRRSPRAGARRIQLSLAALGRFDDHATARPAAVPAGHLVAAAAPQGARGADRGAARGELLQGRAADRVLEQRLLRSRRVRCGGCGARLLRGQRAPPRPRSGELPRGPTAATSFLWRTQRPGQRAVAAALRPRSPGRPRRGDRGRCVGGRRARAAIRSGGA